MVQRKLHGLNSAGQAEVITKHWEKLGRPLPKYYSKPKQLEPYYGPSIQVPIEIRENRRVRGHGARLQKSSFTSHDFPLYTKRLVIRPLRGRMRSGLIIHGFGQGCFAVHQSAASLKQKMERFEKLVHGYRF